MEEFRKILFMGENFGVIFNYSEVIVINGDKVNYFSARSIKDLVTVGLLIEKNGIDENVRNILIEQINDLQVKYEDYIDKNKNNFWVKPDE